MKKSIFVCLLMALASMAWANELGVGYNNGGPSVRFKWDDAVTSELGMIINYNNDAASPAALTEITLSLAPVTLALYRGDLGAINIGFVFKDRIAIKAGKGIDKSVLVTANDYTLNVLLPEVELNFPGVNGLKLIGSIGVGTSWGFDQNGKLETFNMNLFGVSMANAGLVYYFDLGSSKTGAAALPAAAPAATPAAAPAPAVQPAKDATVK